MLLQDIKNDVDVLFMVLSVFFFSFSGASFCVDGKVIHVYQEPSLCHLFPKYGIHHHPEGGRGIHKTEEHDCQFKESFWGEEGCFPFISWFYVYVVVPPLYVKLGKQCASTQAVNSLGNKGRNIAISLCPFVNWMVVLHGSQFAIFLLDEEEICGIWTP